MMQWREVHLAHSSGGDPEGPFGVCPQLSEDLPKVPPLKSPIITTPGLTPPKALTWGRGAESLSPCGQAASIFTLLSASESSSHRHGPFTVVRAALLGFFQTFE